MPDDLEEFYGSVGSNSRSGGKTGRPSAAGGIRNDDYIENPGDIVNSDAADGEARWSEGDGIFWRAKKTHEQLPSGLYNCVHVDGIGAALRRQELNTDDLLVLPENNTANILAEFERFWTLQPKFIDFGFLFKRGFLLWGPPGSGKTSLINLMMKTVIQRYNGIIVVIENPNLAVGSLGMIRKNEPDRPLITIMEDLEALVESYGESEFLNLLDGSEQINNVIHIGTTNYPQRLDKRFVDRPSRFDTVVKIGMPGWDARNAYFKAKLDNKGLDWWSGDELNRWTELSKGLSVAHMREMIISVCCLGQDIEDVIKRLHKMHKIKLSSENDNDGEPMGFVGANGGDDE